MTGAEGDVDPLGIFSVLANFIAFPFVKRHLREPYRIGLARKGLIEFQSVLGRKQRNIGDIRSIEIQKRRLGYEDELGGKIAFVFADSKVDVPTFPEIGDLIQRVTMINSNVSVDARVLQLAKSGAGTQ